MTAGDHVEDGSDDTPAPVTGFHYAMQRVLGPAMGVVVFVVSLIVFPMLIAGRPPPFSMLQLGGLFLFACLAFWAWARHVDKRETTDES